MAEALRTYFNLMNNLTEATRNWVVGAGRVVLAQAGLEEAAADAADRVTKLAEEIANAGRANRQMLGNLVGAEVEQLVARLGFARTDEIDLLREELVDLRARLVEAELAAAAARETAAPTRTTPARKAPAPKAAADASVTKAPAAKKSAAKRAAAKTAAAASTPPVTAEE